MLQRIYNEFSALQVYLALHFKVEMVSSNQTYTFIAQKYLTAIENKIMPTDLNLLRLEL